MKNHILGFCLLAATLFSTPINAQDWEKRHAFAKAYFGAGAYYVPSLQLYLKTTTSEFEY